MCYTILRADYVVSIENQLSSDELIVHCINKGRPSTFIGKKGHDFGEHMVPVKTNYSFTVPNWAFSDNDVYCNVTCPNILNKTYSLRAFVSMFDFIDHYCGGRHCFWKVSDVWISLFNLKKKQYVDIFKWPNMYNTTF
ncbi:hypothetical protein RND81_04G093100 [Saponaria officinalis]|uniref:S-protein homolog n=1 Tax=Saponaria officinalis TaxID=3572 RepID=A0AAW1LK69_SAPOF